MIIGSLIYYLALKRNDFLLHAKEQMDLEDVTLNEINPWTQTYRCAENRQIRRHREWNGAARGWRRRKREFSFNENSFYLGG